MRFEVIDEGPTRVVIARDDGGKVRARITAPCETEIRVTAKHILGASFDGECATMIVKLKPGE